MAGDDAAAAQIVSGKDATQAIKTAIDDAKTPGGDGIFSHLTDNPFFTAGFGLAILAAALKTGQQGVRQGAALVRRRMLVDLEITSRDEAYPWLLRWMSENHAAQSVSRKLAGETEATQPGTRRGLIASLADRVQLRLHHLQISTTKGILPDGTAHTRFSIVPGPGRYIMRYGPAFMFVNRQREKSINVHTGEPFETVTLTTLYSYRHAFQDIFAEANEMASQSQEGKTVVYKSRGVDWQTFGQPKRKRPLKSVILEEGVKERITADLKAFLDTRTWYLDRGIPYQRGYLLYGPPGTGKTSFIQALAGELDFNIAMLNVAERGMTDDRLDHLLSNLPARTIVLLEDADAAFVNRRQTDEDGYQGGTVTFSGLLNALDGVGSAEGRVIFMTTNHVERLDEALVRPGRVDMTVRLGEATQYQVEHLWDRFYAELDLDGSGKRRFLERAADLGVIGHTSTAALQGLFVYNKDNMEGAIDMVGELAPIVTKPGTLRAAMGSSG